MNKIKGIVVYDTPLQVNKIDWIDEHLDCDTLIADNDDTNNIYVLAYAEKKEYNGELYNLIGKFHNSRILKGLTTQELYTIV